MTKFHLWRLAVEHLLTAVSPGVGRVLSVEGSVTRILLRMIGSK